MIFKEECGANVIHTALHDLSLAIEQYCIDGCYLICMLFYNILVILQLITKVIILFHLIHRYTQ